MPEANVVSDEVGYTLLLEWVDGVPGTDFDLADHMAVAEALGRWQARPSLDEPWVSHRFLRD